MNVRTARRTAALAITVAPLASAANQAVGSIRDRRRFPPPGELIDVGDRRHLHLWRAGEGGPTVIIVPALGAPALEWAAVQRALRDDTTVVLYDRAGLGWSDAAPWPRTAGRMADELHRLLLAAKVPPPYVLVGHSLGGYVVRLYAARHPERLAGMVLVDSSHEDQARRLPGRGRHIDEKKLRALRFQLKPLGAVRAAVALGVKREPRRSAVRWCPADLLEAYVACRLSTNFRRAGVHELLGFDAGAAEVRAEAGHLGNLPLIVVTAGTKDREHRGPQWYAAWREMQDELTQLSEHSRQVVAEHASHHVHHDDPPLVVGAIRELLREARWR